MDEPEQPQVQSDEPLLRRSQRNGSQRSPMIMRFMSEDIGDEGDSTSFEEAISSVDSSKWLKAMEDEMRSMSTDQVCDLVEIPRRAKIVGCK
jgi:hypothetical protein